MSNRRGNRSKRAGSSNSIFSYPVLRSGSWRNLRQSLRRSRSSRRSGKNRETFDSTETSSSGVGVGIEGMEQHRESHGSRGVSHVLEHLRNRFRNEDRRSKRFRPSFALPTTAQNPRYRLEQVSSIDSDGDVFETLNKQLGTGRDSIQRAPIDKEDKTALDNHYFSALLLDRARQAEVCIEMIMSTIRDDTLNKPKEECRQAVEEFVHKVQLSYTETLFHNFKHAVDVAHMTWLIITHYLTKSPYVFGKLDQFFLVVSALCHDAGHFGANNKFLLESDEEGETEIVVFHGLTSTLEHFHVNRAQEIITSCRLFTEEFLPKEKHQELLTLSEELILGTDMDLHDDFISKYIGVVKEESSFLKKLTHKVGLFKTAYPRSFLTAILKISDLANLFRDFEDHLEWSKLIAVEYKAMGEKRSAKDLEVEDLVNLQQTMDKDDCDTVDMAKFTLEFIHQIGIPLATSFKAVSKAASLTLVELVKRNSDEWIRILQEHGDELEDLKTLGVDLDDYLERHPNRMPLRRTLRRRPEPTV